MRDVGSDVRDRMAAGIHDPAHDPAARMQGEVHPGGLACGDRHAVAAPGAHRSRTWFGAVLAVVTP